MITTSFLQQIEKLWNNEQKIRVFKAQYPPLPKHFWIVTGGPRRERSWAAFETFYGAQQYVAAEIRSWFVRELMP